MKVGSMVRWWSIEDHAAITERVKFDSGLVIQLSKTGHDTESALVLFENGNLDWIPTDGLEVVDENR